MAVLTLRVRADTRRHECLFVTGNTTELGNWRTGTSCKMEQIGHQPNASLWKCSVKVVDVRSVQYRYFIGHPIVLSQQEIIVVREMEGKVRSADLKNQDSLTVDDGKFGIDENDHRSVHVGWLEHVSQMHLSLHSSNETCIKLQDDCHQSDFRIKISLVKDGHRLGSSFPSLIEWQILNTIKGSVTDCEPYSDNAVSFNTQQDIISYSWNFYKTNYSSVCLEVLEGKGDREVGRCLVHYDQLAGNLYGTLHQPLFNKEAVPVGTIRLDYMCTNPVQSSLVHDLSKVDSLSYKGKVLYIGHRGAGATFKHLTERRKIKENTIAAFKEGKRNGCHFVELDVQLTADNVPVVYHDFEVSIASKKVDSEECGYHTAMIKDLTYEELTQFCIYHTNVLKEECRDKELMFLNTSGDLESKILPTLQEILEHTPQDIGFDIEVKYPLPNMAGEEMFEFTERNLMANVVIEHVFKFGGERDIVLSSFDADLCHMLNLKQFRYPVLYITQTEMSCYPQAVDLRGRLLGGGIAFVKGKKLRGLAIESESLLADLSLIKRLMDDNLLTVSWGWMNNIRKNVTEQKKKGVNGICCDKVSNFNADSESIE